MASTNTHVSILCNRDLKRLAVLPRMRKSSDLTHPLDASGRQRVHWIGKSILAVLQSVGEKPN
jgi:hypothetical protein